MIQNSKDLTQKALIWAVCRALGHSPTLCNGYVVYRSEHGSWVAPTYTSNDDVGELMNSQWVGVERPSKGQKTPLWRAITDIKVKNIDGLNSVADAWGETIGLAVCRAIVVSHFGKTVDIPEELVSTLPV